ncbi:cytochrome P450 [Oceanicoccus sp. KOV_DT_Chl]|uniref:cytochrome P450 n=1 Tax=Oceanicoccus sp. KOV_DT_Chl TaxID=1904639 RepID=UPI000C79AB67|nr:cytochrome P450 [Oceanicoccus sp. KOV_DT_Chl]
MSKCPVHIDLVDPDIYREGVPNHFLKELRAEAPLAWYDDKSTGVGFWAVTKHEDLDYISKHPLIFSSAEKTCLMREMNEEAVAMQRLMMINMDPPDHLQNRRIVNKAFIPKVIESKLANIKDISKEIVDKVAAKGECEFVTEVATDLPLIVICELMGVKKEDRQMIFDCTNTMVFADDPDMSTSEEDGQMAAAQIYTYGMQLLAEHRENPTDSLTGILVDSVDGEGLSEDEFCSFFLILLVAGNETTRTVTVNGMRLLMEHPEQLQAIAADMSLLPNAVEEMLRHQPAVIQFRRTVMEDVVVSGQQLKKGDKVIMFYPSANRDEALFDEGDAFDIYRNNADQHRSFGIGEHFCLGSHLARLELRVIFEEVISRMKNPKFAAPVKRLRSNFINGIKEMKITFDPEV